jgi:tetratricopeptide (TPR) repeat protein
MKYSKQVFLLLFTFTTATTVFAQSGYDKLGMQAMMKGDFKSAVKQLEKAGVKSPNNTNVLKMLGYSYYQCGDYDNAISTFTKLISLKPAEYYAYYYRGKARQNIANDPKESLNQMRDNFYLSAIQDFTKAIQLVGEEDAQLLQNRGIAYKDYAIFKSYKIKKKAEKTACITLFNSALSDFQKILVVQPQRRDIITLMDYVKAQVTSLK